MIRSYYFFFKSSSFGSNIPIYAVSAKNKVGFEDLKNGILEVIKSLEIKRELEGDLIIPIDHHFSVKGRGSILTGTILKGKLKLNQNLEDIKAKIQQFESLVNQIKSENKIVNFQLFIKKYEEKWPNIKASFQALLNSVKSDLEEKIKNKEEVLIERAKTNEDKKADKLRELIKLIRDIIESRKTKDSRKESWTQ